MAALNTLTDQFLGPDTAKWRIVTNNAGGQGPAYGAVNGRWRFGSATFNDWVRLVSQATWDASADLQAIYFRLWRGTNHSIEVALYDTTGKGLAVMVGSSGSLIGEQVTSVAGDIPTTTVPGGNGTFNSAWEWIKIQHNLAGGYFEFFTAPTSGTGPGTWTKYTGFAASGNLVPTAGTDLTALIVNVYTRSAGAGGTVTEVGGLNTTLPAAPTGNPAFSWTDTFATLDTATTWNAPVTSGSDLTSTASVANGVLQLITNAGSGRVTLASKTAFDLTSGSPVVATKMTLGARGSTVSLGFAASGNSAVIAEAVFRNASAQVPQFQRRAVDVNGAIYMPGATTFDASAQTWVRLSYVAALYGGFGGFQVESCGDNNGAPGAWSVRGTFQVPPGMDVRSVRLVLYADNAFVGVPQRATFTPFNVLTSYHTTYLDQIYDLLTGTSLDRRVWFPFSQNSSGDVALDGAGKLQVTTAAGSTTNTGVTSTYAAAVRPSRIQVKLDHPASNNTKPRVRVRDNAGIGVEVRATTTGYEAYILQSVTGAGVTGTAGSAVVFATTDPYIALTWDGAANFTVESSANGTSWTSRTVLNRPGFDAARAWLDLWALVDTAGATVSFDDVGHPPITTVPTPHRRRRRRSA